MGLGRLRHLRRALRDALAAALPAELPRLVAGRWGVRPSVRRSRV